MRQGSNQAAHIEPCWLEKKHTCHPAYAKNNFYSIVVKSLLIFKIITKSLGYQGFPEVVQFSASKQDKETYFNLEINQLTSSSQSHPSGCAGCVLYRVLCPSEWRLNPSLFQPRCYIRLEDSHFLTAQKLFKTSATFTFCRATLGYKSRITAVKSSGFKHIQFRK